MSCRNITCCTERFQDGRYPIHSPKFYRLAIHTNELHHCWYYTRRRSSSFCSRCQLRIPTSAYMCMVKKNRYKMARQLLYPLYHLPGILHVYSSGRDSNAPIDFKRSLVEPSAVPNPEMSKTAKDFHRARPATFVPDNIFYKRAGEIPSPCIEC